MSDKESFVGIIGAATLLAVLAGCGGSQPAEIVGEQVVVAQSPDAGVVADASPVAVDPGESTAPGPAGLPMNSLDDLIIGEGKHGEPPPLATEIKADLEYQEKTFEMLEELDEVPSFISAKTLLRAIPKAYREEREQIEYALGDEGNRSLELEGAYLDAEKNTMIIRYQYGALENVFLVLSADGKLIGKLTFNKRTGSGFLVDIAQDSTKEIIIPVIEGMGMSSYPESWRIYGISKGKLKKLGRITKSFSSGSKWETHHFFNAVTFPEKGRIRVETVIHEGGRITTPVPMKGVPDRLGEVREYAYKGRTFKLSSFEKGKLDADTLDPLDFHMVIHVASTEREDTKRRIEKKLLLANEKYSDVAIGFDIVDDWNYLPDDFAILEESSERHKLKKYLVDKAINIFVVDKILDPHPSKATKKAAAWQGRKPSGRLAGAHIEVKNRKPRTYIILSRTSADVSLTHELGHFFGLPHHKDPSNIMSYGRDRSVFSNRQLEIIRRVAQKTARKKWVNITE